MILWITILLVYILGFYITTYLTSSTGVNDDPIVAILWFLAPVVLIIGLPIALIVKGYDLIRQKGELVYDEKNKLVELNYAEREELEKFRAAALKELGIENADC